MTPEQIQTIQFWSDIANIVIAAVAVITLIITAFVSFQTYKGSQKTNLSIQKTTEALQAIQTGMEALTLPIVKYLQYDWLNQNLNTDLSFNNPPVGIVVTYGNVSNITVAVENVELDTFYGELKLQGIVMSRYGAKKRLLTPGESTQIQFAAPDLFQKYLHTPKDPLAEPFPSIILELTFHRIDTGKRYRYRTHQATYFSGESNQGHVRLQQNLEETLEEITN